MKMKHNLAHKLQKRNRRWPKFAATILQHDKPRSWSRTRLYKVRARQPVSICRDKVANFLSATGTPSYRINKHDTQLFEKQLRSLIRYLKRGTLTGRWSVTYFNVKLNDKRHTTLTENGAEIGKWRWKSALLNGRLNVASKNYFLKMQFKRQVPIVLELFKNIRKWLFLLGLIFI